jgi:ubiquinone/menaquinone biosynthesis C-methylase UbiE
MSPPAADSRADPDAVASAQSFYTRWARAYDVLARNAPGAGKLRQRAVTALDPAAGDVVLDLGCGTGANFPYLREAVGSEGAVVGVDFAPGPVEIARRRADDWQNVHVVRGDATQLPCHDRVPGSPDAVLASFVVGMLPDPGSVVRSWADLLGQGGRLGLVDLARSRVTPWRLFNPVFAILTRASAPPGSDARNDADAVSVLDRRVDAAHDALAACCVEVHESTHVGGFARIGAGEVGLDGAGKVDVNNADEVDAGN